MAIPGYAPHTPAWCAPHRCRCCACSPTITLPVLQLPAVPLLGRCGQGETAAPGATQAHHPAQTQATKGSAPATATGSATPNTADGNQQLTYVTGRPKLAIGVLPVAAALASNNKLMDKLS